MHNKPVKVHIQIKDRIKSQVIKKQVRTKENIFPWLIKEI